MRHVFLCLLTLSSDIWVGVRFFVSLLSSLSSFSSLFLLLSSFFSLLSSLSVKHCADAASAVLCLVTQVVMVHQRSWCLFDDWKEVAHSRSSCWNRKKSNNKSSSGWKWKSWTTCQFEGCCGWVYDHQKRSFCPQCIRPLTEPAPARSPSVEPMCSPCGGKIGTNISRR